MDYKLENTNSIFYLPKIEHWILKDLHLKLYEAMLYKLILQKGSFTWNAKYIGEVLVISRDTVLRLVSKLQELGLVEKRIKVYSNRKRWVLVALYTTGGKRTSREVNQLFEEGFKKLEADMPKKYHNYYI